MSDYKDWINQNPLTIVDSGSLHFRLEYREVEAAGQQVELHDFIVSVHGIGYKFDPIP